MAKVQQHKLTSRPPNIQWYFDQDVRAAVERWARFDRRSISNEITFLLRLAIQVRERLHEDENASLDSIVAELRR